MCSSWERVRSAVGWITPPTAVLRARQQQRMNRSGVGWVPLWTVGGEGGCRGGSWAHGGHASHTDPHGQRRGVRPPPIPASSHFPNFLKIFLWLY